MICIFNIQILQQRFTIMNPTLSASEINIKIWHRVFIGGTLCTNIIFFITFCHNVTTTCLKEKPSKVKVAYAVVACDNAILEALATTPKLLQTGICFYINTYTHVCTAKLYGF